MARLFYEVKHYRVHLASGTVGRTSIIALGGFPGRMCRLEARTYRIFCSRWSKITCRILAILPTNEERIYRPISQMKAVS